MCYTGIFDTTKLPTLVESPKKTRKTLDSNDQNQVADQRFSLKQLFAGGAQSRGLRKPGCGHCYVRFFGKLGVGEHAQQGFYSQTLATWLVLT